MTLRAAAHAWAHVRTGAQPGSGDRIATTQWTLELLAGRPDSPEAVRALAAFEVLSD